MDQITSGPLGIFNNCEHKDHVEPQEFNTNGVAEVLTQVYIVICRDVLPSWLGVGAISIQEKCVCACLFVCVCGCLCLASITHTHRFLWVAVFRLVVTLIAFQVVNAKTNCSMHVVIHGYAWRWIWMDMDGYGCIWMAMDGHAWICMSMDGYVWICMSMDG